MKAIQNISATAIIALVLTCIPLTLAHATDDRISKIQDASHMRICQVDYPPLNIKDPVTGKWTGLLVEMAEAFAASIDVEVTHVDATWGTVLQNVKTGKCDISSAATFVTAKRAMQLLFTDVVTEDTQAAFVRSDSGLTSYADLNRSDKVIVVMSGSINEANARKTLPNAEVKPIISDRQHTPLLEVAAGRADAAFLSVMGSMNFLTKNENVKLRPVDNTKLFPAPVAWMVPKGEYHLQQVIKAWLASARAKGILDAMEAKWMRAN
jgi:ABC-type amino acid transport substrate-binding protein